MHRMNEQSVSTVTNQPETNLLMFAVLLNYSWELTQAPLYQGLATAAYWTVVKGCARATLGDAFIMLVAYWSIAGIARNRWWFVRAARLPFVGFLGIGIVLTIVIERLALRSSWSGWGWRYSEAMPLVPWLEIGLTPLLQWLTLPVVTLWLVRRQTAARAP